MVSLKSVYVSRVNIYPGSGLFLSMRPMIVSSSALHSPAPKVCNPAKSTPLDRSMRACPAQASPPNTNCFLVITATINHTVRARHGPCSYGTYRGINKYNCSISPSTTLGRLSAKSMCSVKD